MTNAKICTLFFIILLNVLVETEAVSCCLRYTKQSIPCRRLKGYDIQGITAGCDIAAIIFHTVRGRMICADPEQSWTQERVRCLKMKAEAIKTPSIF